MVNLNFVRGKLDCEVEVFDTGIDEGGNPVGKAFFRGKGFFQESGREAIDKDGRTITLAGRLLIEGDVAPGVAFIGSGVARVVMVDGNVREMRIVEGKRARGLDGCVSHTTLRLV